MVSAECTSLCREISCALLLRCDWLKGAVAFVICQGVPKGVQLAWPWRCFFFFFHREERVCGGRGLFRREAKRSLNGRLQESRNNRSVLVVVFAFPVYIQETAACVCSESEDCANTTGSSVHFCEVGFARCKRAGYFLKAVGRQRFLIRKALRAQAAHSEDSEQYFPLFVRSLCKLGRT